RCGSHESLLPNGFSLPISAHRKGTANVFLDLASVTPEGSGPEWLLPGEAVDALGQARELTAQQALAAFGQHAQGRCEIDALARQIGGQPDKCAEIVDGAQPFLQPIAALVVGLGAVAIEAFQVLDAVAQLLGALAQSVKAGCVALVAIVEAALGLARQAREHL